MIVPLPRYLSFDFVLFLLFTFHYTLSNAMLRSRPTAFAVRVVSYNVLSSHLASPSHFSTLDPAHLDASYRLPLVLKKLDDEIKESENSVVLCLQEVSYDWAAAFHCWFANRGYHMITGLYGKKFNGYMGVAVAYPIEDFETLGVDISRLSDKRVGGWPRPPVEEKSLSTRVLSSVNSLWTIPLKTLGLWKRPPEDHWSMSERRFNVLVSATLCNKKTKQKFVVGNYHMPCAFYAPMAMTIHSEMAARHVQDLAAAVDEGIPYILAGDFNIKPTDSMYHMLKTAKMDDSDPAFPTPKHGMEWACTAAPMKSAYHEKLGKEPDFTNFARVQEKDPFIDTLDYVFLSPHWRVNNVKELPHRDDADGPFPNEKEPSDHILLSADIEIDV